MGIEDRRNPRIFLASPCDADWGRIEINGCEIPCASVHDVSVSGAGIAVPLDLEPGSSITMRLTAAKVDIAIRGSVVWKRSDPIRHGFPTVRAGIAFDAADEETCYLFYGLVRSSAPSLDAIAV